MGYDYGDTHVQDEFHLLEEEFEGDMKNIESDIDKINDNLNAIKNEVLCGVKTEVDRTRKIEIGLSIGMVALMVLALL